MGDTGGVSVSTSSTSAVVAVARRIIICIFSMVATRDHLHCTPLVSGELCEMNQDEEYGVYYNTM